MADLAHYPIRSHIKSKSFPVLFAVMNVGDSTENLNTFLEEYMEHIGEDAKEIRRDLQLIRDLDEVSVSENM